MRLFYLILYLIFGCAYPAVPPLFPSLLERLHDAIAQGDVESIQSLIALTADPNVIYLQRTAMQTALVYKKPAVIRCLLNHEAHLSDDSIVLLLRSGNEQYAIEDVFASLKILLVARLVAGGEPQPIDEFPRGYLAPVMIAHGDSEAIHARVIKMIQHHGKQKIA